MVSLLAQHQSNSSTGHYDASLYVSHYLAHTKSLGISFSSCRRATLESFLHFPVPATTLSMTDANWGPQDASLSGSSQDLPLFVS